MAPAVVNLFVARLSALWTASASAGIIHPLTIFSASTAVYQSASDAPRSIPLRMSSIWLSRFGLHQVGDVVGLQCDVRPRGPQLHHDREAVHRLPLERRLERVVAAGEASSCETLKWRCAVTLS